MLSRCLLCIVTVACCRTALAQPVEGADGRLTDPAGRVLYTFDRDSAGVSACKDECAVQWPPFSAPPDASAKPAFPLLRRDDGSLQWAHHGKPLYYFVGDAKPGQASGDGLGGTWHVARTRPAEIPDGGPSYSPKGY